MENKKIYDVDLAIKAQKSLQKEKGYPDFAPSNGICYSCKRQIYSAIIHNNGDYTTGIDLEKATKELVTGCPHCNRSYCD
jgi:hypothetical protein